MRKWAAPAGIPTFSFFISLFLIPHFSLAYSSFASFSAVLVRPGSLSSAFR